MRKPEKPGTRDSKTQEGGALGTIDEQTGDPGKGTSGATPRAEDDPAPSPAPSKDPKPETPRDRGKPA